MNITCTKGINKLFYTAPDTRMLSSINSRLHSFILYGSLVALYPTTVTNSKISVWSCLKWSKWGNTSWLVLWVLWHSEASCCTWPQPRPMWSKYPAEVYLPPSCCRSWYQSRNPFKIFKIFFWAVFIVKNK